MTNKFLAVVANLALALNLGTVARAQDQSAPPPPPDDQAQAPAPASTQPQADGQPEGQADAAAPGAGRVSFIHGNVSTQHGDNGEWTAATVNTPVMPGDRVSTGAGSRAEIQLDYANILRLDHDSQAKVADLTRSRILLQIGGGLVNYDVVRSGGPEPEIDTPNVAIKPLGAGSYRVQVDSNSQTEVVVRSGEVEIATPQGSTKIEAGQMITVQGTDNPQYQVVDAPQRDEWDQFNTDRDNSISHADSWRHTDPYYTGTQDLDNYGHWETAPDYGSVWVPAVAPGWAPYQAGRWVWEPYYGWTWVSYEPWGWAPYHYGRWFVYGGGWAWWPGPVGVYPGFYPVWAPAYVSFFGWHGGFGFGFGFGFGGWGGIGWLPIGPGDWYHPWWGRWGGAHVTVVNNFNMHGGFAPLAGRGFAHPFSNLHEMYTNDRVRAGLTAMRGDEFGRTAVDGHFNHVSAGEIRQASMFSGRSPVTPTRASYQSVDRAPNASTMRASGNEHFFSGSQAPNRTLSARNTSSRPFESSNNARSASNSRGSFNPPNDRAFSARGNTATNEQARPGWHNFSENGGRGYSNYGTARGSQPGFGGRSYGQSNRPAYNESRPSYSRPSYSRPSYSTGSRPQLNMRQPIATPRGGNEGSRGNWSHFGGQAPRSSGGNRGGGSHGGGGGSHPSGGRPHR